ncbi:MAG TPA: hypothetical protein VLT90_05190 [Terriglobales bacterium]|nr:hypothetical protein [Terriglobales bacterium]
MGEIAKKSKQSAGPKAKAVITDENMKTRRGPIPGISLEGPDNSDEIITAIREFRKNHKPEETEEAVRLWYDEFDSLFATVLDDNTRLVQRKEDRSLTEATGGYYGSDGDYNRAVQRRNSAISQDRDDFRRQRKNGFMVARIQQTFIKVRNDLQAIGLRFEWFKIRNANGNGTF